MGTCWHHTHPTPGRRASVLHLDPGGAGRHEDLQVGPVQAVRQSGGGGAVQPTAGGGLRGRRPAVRALPLRRRREAVTLQKPHQTRLPGGYLPSNTPTGLDFQVGISLQKPHHT